MTTQPPICPYCGKPSERVTGADVYRHRSDLRAKVIYRCLPCKAHVGCHDGTDKPLGRLANAELRAAKMKAHAAFDPIWKGQAKQVRSEAYGWLAAELGIPKRDCHIGMFDVATCDRVISICAARLREPANV